MKVGIIGSGGREHAICYFLKKSKKVSEIFCFPGNAGTEFIAKNVLIKPDNFDHIKNFILEKDGIKFLTSFFDSILDALFRNFSIK